MKAKTGYLITPARAIAALKGSRAGATDFTIPAPGLVETIQRIEYYDRSLQAAADLRGGRGPGSPGYGCMRSLAFLNAAGVL